MGLLRPGMSTDPLRKLPFRELQHPPLIRLENPRMS